MRTLRIVLVRGKPNELDAVSRKTVFTKQVQRHAAAARVEALVAGRIDQQTL